MQTWGEQNNFVKFGFGLLCVLAGPFFFCSQGDILIEKVLNRLESYKLLVDLQCVLIIA
jgi:hypothetical protein